VQLRGGRCPPPIFFHRKKRCDAEDVGADARDNGEKKVDHVFCLDSILFKSREYVLPSRGTCLEGARAGTASHGSGVWVAAARRCGGEVEEDGLAFMDLCGLLFGLLVCYIWFAENLLGDNIGFPGLRSGLSERRTMGRG
jgi:hypothetical protein